MKYLIRALSILMLASTFAFAQSAPNASSIVAPITPAPQPVSVTLAISDNHGPYYAASMTVAVGDTVSLELIAPPGVTLPSSVTMRINGVLRSFPTSAPLAYGQSGAALSGVTSTGPTSIVGNQTNGDDAISHVNVNGAANIRAYGAVSSTESATCSISASSTALSCGSAADFVNGQHVVVPHAGAATSLSTPASLAVQSSKWDANLNVTTDGAGSTDYTYTVAAVDGVGGVTAAPTAVTITNGEATLSFDKFNQITWTAVSSAIAYRVYGCNGASCSPALIAIIPATSFLTSGTPTFWDMGLHFNGDAIDGTAVPSAALADNLFTTISSGGGTPTLTLGAAAATSASSVPVYHDNQPAIQAALAAVCTNGSPGGEVLIPAGIYEFAQTITVSGCNGIRIIGQGGELVTGSVLSPVGQAGMIGMTIDATFGSSFENFSIGQGAADTTLGVGIWLGKTLNNDSQLKFDGIQIGEHGAGIENGPGNNDDMRFTHIYIGNDNVQSAAGLVGWLLDETNSVGLRIADSSDGLDLVSIDEVAGDYQTYNYGYVGYIANLLGSESAPIVISRPTAETQIRRFLVQNPGSSTSTSQLVTIRNGRLNPTEVSADGYYISFPFGGGLLLENNDFADGLNHVSPWAIFVNANEYNGMTALTSIGNSYPNASPFSAQNNLVGANLDNYLSLGDIYTTGSTMAPLLTVLPTHGDRVNPLGTLSSGTTTLQGAFSMFTALLGGNITVAMPSNSPVAGGQGQWINLLVQQAASGGPYGITWSGVTGSPPAVTSTASGYTNYRFFTPNGTTWIYVGP